MLGTRLEAKETNPSTYFAERRKKLLANFDPKTKSILVLFSAPMQHRNGDQDFPFRQQSDFYYLTGIEEAQSIVVLIPGEKNKFVIFNQFKDPKKEIWTGKLIGQDAAREVYGADEAYPIEEFNNFFPKLLTGCEKVYYSISERGKKINPEFETLLLKAIENRATENVLPFVHEMRLIKDPFEIDCMRQAIEISAKGHFRTMLLCDMDSMSYEFELEAEFVYPIVKHGARGVGYPNIVGTGENGCILHYGQNNAKVRKNTLALVDAGAEFKNYTADITRTFPVNGKFSPEQRALYEVVLAAQEAGIKAVVPGATWRAINNVVTREVTSGLMKLGILSGMELQGEAFNKKLNEHLKNDAYLPFYMHGCGHWLGLDVHDVGLYKKDEKYYRIFEPGMVLTIEPGIYISKTASVEPRWHDIGIRIEDDVLVTENGCEVLSEFLPRKVSDIEKIMAGTYQLIDPRLMNLKEYEKLVAEKRALHFTSAPSSTAALIAMLPRVPTAADNKHQDTLKQVSDKLNDVDATSHEIIPLAAHHDHSHSRPAEPSLRSM